MVKENNTLLNSNDGITTGCYIELYSCLSYITAIFTNYLMNSYHTLTVHV